MVKIDGFRLRFFLKHPLRMFQPIPIRTSLQSAARPDPGANLPAETGNVCTRIVSAHTHNRTHKCILYMYIMFN